MDKSEMYRQLREIGEEAAQEDAQAAAQANAIAHILGVSPEDVAVDTYDEVTGAVCLTLEQGAALIAKLLPRDCTGPNQCGAGRNYWPVCTRADCPMKPLREFVK